MKPYSRNLRATMVIKRSLVVAFIICAVLISTSSNVLAADDTHPANTHIADLRTNPLIRSGDEHYYSLEYDKAIRDYENLEQEQPTDCFAINEVLKTVVFQELYRLNLLDTTLYAKEGFLSGKSQPEASDQAVRRRMDQLYERALMLEENRLKQNANDADALYCRGVTRGLKSTYMALVDRAFISALKLAVAARHDHERVLQLDPKYVDAKLIVGTHLYVVGALPMPIKILAGITGLSGSKKKGIEYLRELGAANTYASVDARVALALFLRREAQYGDALQVVGSLVREHPRNFLFALEEANLEKDMGNASAAATSYRKLLEQDKERFPEAHLELAAFGLGEVLKGQRNFAEAAKAYDSVVAMKSAQSQMKTRSTLAAGEMYDQLGNREMAMRRYRQVINADGTGSYAALAQKHMKRPYDGLHG
jgi:tetratricopeptide (TPR) repeat protein